MTSIIEIYKKYPLTVNSNIMRCSKLLWKEFKMTSDLSYQNHGLFTRFYPNTKAGEGAWNIMAQEDGVAAVLTIHAANVIAQLKKAGYNVSKAKKVEMTIDEILTELETI